MSNRMAIVLLVAIVGAVLLDHYFNHGVALMFTLRKFSDAIEYLSFWR